MPTLPLFGTGFKSKSVTVTAQRRLNCYLEPVGDEAKQQFAIYGTPGLTLFSTLGAPVRGMRAIGNVLYVVAGQYLYSVNNAGAATIVGTLGTSTGLVSMADNGLQLMIVDGASGYIFTLASSSFATIVAAGFPANTSSVVMLNGYFVVNSSGSGRFYWSTIYDGTAWDSLDFATAESSPDNLVAIATLNGQLVLFGEQTTEFWGASGDTGVWRRIGGAGIEWGLAAPWTVAKFGGGLGFLAKNPQGQVQAVVLSGYSVDPVTEPEVANKINAEEVGGAVAFSYMIDAHPFYQINVGAISLLYDGLTKVWSDLESDGARHWGQVRAELLSRPLVSDYRNGNLYVADPEAYTDNGTTIVRELQGRHLIAGYEWMVCWEVFVDMEVGVGLETGQGSDPKAMLQSSRDGGKTWSNERWAPMGRSGETYARAVWRRFGIARDWVFRLKVSDPVKFVIAGAAMKVGA